MRRPSWRDSVGVTHQEDPDVMATVETHRVWHTACGLSLTDMLPVRGTVDCMACITRNIDDA